MAQARHQYLTQQFFFFIDLFISLDKEASFKQGKQYAQCF